MDDRLLQLYLEGNTTDEESRIVTNWLEEDAHNMHYYQQLYCRLYEINLWNIPSEESRATKPISLRRSFVRKSIEIAAIFVLGFMVNYLINFSKENSAILSMQTVYAPKGQYASVILADGSKVWLNAGSKLRFPTRFDANQRSVELEGEALFEVKADKTCPFIVSTENYSVKALGTSFNVCAYKQSTKFETALLTGKVDVANKNTGQSLTLSPNSRAVLVKGQLTTSPIQDVDYFLWREGILFFNEPLESVLERLELYFDVKIKIENKHLFDVRQNCTGKFRTRDGLNHILTVLQTTNHFTYHKNEAKNLITIK